MKRILCLFDYACTTGFGTVSQNIVSRLKEHYGKELHLDILAINYFGQAYKEYSDTVNVYPASTMEKGTKYHDLYGRHVFLLFLGNNDYDGIFIIQDPGVVLGNMMKGFQDILKNKRASNRKQPKSIFYYPVDGPMFKEEMHQHFDLFDQLVAYTEYGRSQTMALYPQLRKKIQVVPHGINTNDFYHIESEDVRKENRERLFGINAHKEIFINLNRNQFRKDIPTTIWAFEELKQENPHLDVFLYLHMTPHEKEMGWDLKRVLSQTSLQEGIDYQFPHEKDWNAQASVRQVNKIYNACDFYVTTTTGGGWELPVTEAMACRLPVIAPLHTSIKEISENGKTIIGLENQYPFCSRYDNTRRYQCDYIEVAEKMKAALGLPGYVKEKALLAEQAVKKLNWNIVCKRWIELFDKWFM